MVRPGIAYRFSRSGVGYCRHSRHRHDTAGRSRTGLGALCHDGHACVDRRADAIRAAIAEGAPGALIVGDRRAAIAAAIAEAKADDIVCIAGKGHEQGQIVGRGDDMRIIPFDDVAVAREAAA